MSEEERRGMMRATSEGHAGLDEVASRRGGGWGEETG